MGTFWNGMTRTGRVVGVDVIVGSGFLEWGVRSLKLYFGCTWRSG